MDQVEQAEDFCPNNKKNHPVKLLFHFQKRTIFKKSIELNPKWCSLMHHQMLKIGTLILKARNEPVIGTSQLPKVKNVMPKALGPSFHPILTPNISGLQYYWFST